RILESPGFTGTDKGRKIMETVHGSMRREGLVRPREGRVLGGVVAGLGRRFGLDPWVARLLFVLILMVIPGSQILIYPILWILIPNEEPDPRPVTTPPTACPPPRAAPRRRSATRAQGVSRATRLSRNVFVAQRVSTDAGLYDFRW